MGDWTSPQYILSQVFVSLGYILFAITYFVTRRQNLLWTNIGGNIAMVAGFSLLGGWVAVAMCSIGIFRDLTSSMVNALRKRTRRMKKTRLDWFLLAFWISMFTIATVFTHEGFLTMFAYFSTVIFTISIWQKNVFVYRVLGIFACAPWIVYNAVLESVMGVVIESILLVFMIVGVITHLKNVKARKKRQPKNQAWHTAQKRKAKTYLRRNGNNGRKQARPRAFAVAKLKRAKC